MAALTVNKRRGGKRLSQRRAARILGVSFEHLNRVLRGHRSSPRLVELYNEVIARHQRRGAAATSERESAPPKAG